MKPTNHTNAHGLTDQSRAREEAARITQSSRAQRLSDHNVGREGLEERNPSEHGPLPHGRGSECGRGSEHGRSPGQWRHSDALAYLITFSSYGTWLHGDQRSSVDRDHNIPGTPCVDPNPRRRRYEDTMLKHPAVVLGSDRRAVVHDSIEALCEHRNWTLHALNVRSNHVHALVSAPEPPERVMNDFKSWASRGLMNAGLIRRETRTWTRHGSTRYLWKPHELRAAGDYVCEHQGADLE